MHYVKSYASLLAFHLTHLCFSVCFHMQCNVITVMSYSLYQYILTAVAKFAQALAPVCFHFHYYAINSLPVGAWHSTPVVVTARNKSFHPVTCTIYVLEVIWQSHFVTITTYHSLKANFYISTIKHFGKFVIYIQCISDSKVIILIAILVCNFTHAIYVHTKWQHVTPCTLLLIISIHEYFLTYLVCLPKLMCGWSFHMCRVGYLTQ